MPKVRIFLRIARNGKRYKFAVNQRPTYSPISDSNHYYPTIGFALDLDIPDKAFRQAEQVIAEIRIPEKDLEICAEVQEIEG